MVDTKTPGDKKLSVPSKTLSLKPRVETGTVRQSFSHGRSKQVVVEKRGKRRVDGSPEPQVAEVAKPAPAAAAPKPAPARPAPPRNAGSGVVLRTLTEDERSARASALADAKVREVEERRHAEEDDQRRAVRESAERADREGAQVHRKAAEACGAGGRQSPPKGRGGASPPRRGSQAEGRNRGQEAFWRRRAAAI